jgi:tRNA pseudouridine38-40 synthase
VGSRRYIVKFAFDGSNFEGYARQPSGHTVEDELIGALRHSKIISDAPKASFMSASRVDRRVSAISAAVAFDTDAIKDRILGSINASAPSILAHSIAEVEAGFDPRRRADSRAYRYHYPRTNQGVVLDVQMMGSAADLFLGEHNFGAFAKMDGRKPIRVIEAIGLKARDDVLVLDILGRSFLWNQVRKMATAIERVGTGEMGLDDISTALKVGRGDPLPPAPPEGLILMDVNYEGLEFKPALSIPKGTMKGLRENYYLLTSEVRYYDYLRERFRF